MEIRNLTITLQIDKTQFQTFIAIAVDLANIATSISVAAIAQQNIQDELIELNQNAKAISQSLSVISQELQKSQVLGVTYSTPKEKK